MSKHQSLHGLESEWRIDEFWKPLVAQESIFGLGTQGKVRAVISFGMMGTWLRPTGDALGGEEMLSNLKGPSETGIEARSTHNEHMLILLISIILITLPTAS